MKANKLAGNWQSDPNVPNAAPYCLLIRLLFWYFHPRVSRIQMSVKFECLRIILTLIIRTGNTIYLNWVIRCVPFIVGILCAHIAQVPLALMLLLLLLYFFCLGMHSDAWTRSAIMFHVYFIKVWTHSLALTQGSWRPRVTFINVITALIGFVVEAISSDPS